MVEPLHQGMVKRTREIGGLQAPREPLRVNYEPPRTCPRSTYLVGRGGPRRLASIPLPAIWELTLPLPARWALRILHRRMGVTLHPCRTRSRAIDWDSQGQRNYRDQQHKAITEHATT